MTWTPKAHSVKQEIMCDFFLFTSTCFPGPPSWPATWNVSNERACACSSFSWVIDGVSCLKGFSYSSTLSPIYAHHHPLLSGSYEWNRTPTSQLVWAHGTGSQSGGAQSPAGKKDMGGRSKNMGEQFEWKYLPESGVPTEHRCQLVVNAVTGGARRPGPNFWLFTHPLFVLTWKVGIALERLSDCCEDHAEADEGLRTLPGTRLTPREWLLTITWK